MAVRRGGLGIGPKRWMITGLSKCLLALGASNSPDEPLIPRIHEQQGKRMHHALSAATSDIDGDDEKYFFSFIALTKLLVIVDRLVDGKIAHAP